MSISFDKALGIHEHSVSLRASRAEILAKNLANADTPGYKATDMDFDKVLKNISESTSNKSLKLTHEKHFNTDIDAVDENIMYRTPLQPSLDGNTVDAHVENSEFSSNAMRYMASLQFLDGKFKGLMGAIRGE